LDRLYAVFFYIIIKYKPLPIMCSLKNRSEESYAEKFTANNFELTGISTVFNDSLSLDNRTCLLTYL